MTTMIRQLAALSTALILVALFGLVYIVLGTLGLDQGLALMSSFFVCVLLTPITWRFSKREAELMNGDTNADRKD